MKKVCCRIILALVFLFSGIAKSLNPYGFSVKVGEYLSAMHMDFLLPLQSVLGILIPALEIFLALLLLFRIMPRPVSITVTSLLALFAALTLWDLVAKPVGDCGCFGDVVKLTPWQSFLKNILLLALAVWYMLLRDTPATMSAFLLYSRILTFALCSLMLPVLVYKHLPLYDVSGYVPGTVVASSDNDVELIYRNIQSGELQSFSLSDTQWQDSSVWKFEEVREAKQTMPLPMLRDDFTDVSSDVLSSSDSILIVVLQDPNDLPDLTNSKIRPVVLSAFDINRQDVEHYGCDFSLLRQIVPNRHGGALLVYDGVILEKWAMRDCPYLDL